MLSLKGKGSGIPLGRAKGEDKRTEKQTQRAENGGVGSVVVESAFLGAPRFSVRSSETGIGGSKTYRALEGPEGPSLEKIQDRTPGLKFSSEIETNDICKRD